MRSPFVRLCAAALVLLVGLVAAASDERIIGNKKKGVKGRYLAIEKGVDLSQYSGALVILEDPEIQSDKDRPVDTEAIQLTAAELLEEAFIYLKQRGCVSAVATSAPLVLPESTPILRVAQKLTVQHGSQAMRAFVGMGAGKSQTHILVDIGDARTGEHLATFNGYGSGSGTWGLGGGGVQRMARDDLRENFNEMREYLARVMPPAPRAAAPSESDNDAAALETPEPTPDTGEVR